MFGFQRHPSVMYDDAPFEVEPAPAVTQEQMDRLQELAYFACDAAAALALAEKTRVGLKAAVRAEKRTWAELTAAIHALAA